MTLINIQRDGMGEVFTICSPPFTHIGIQRTQRQCSADKVLSNVFQCVHSPAVKTEQWNFHSSLKITEWIKNRIPEQNRKSGGKPLIVMPQTWMGGYSVKNKTKLRWVQSSEGGRTVLNHTGQIHWPLRNTYLPPPFDSHGKSKKKKIETYTQRF